jgi:hypothetical protein
VCKKLRFAAGILIVIITAGMCGCLKNRQVEAGIGSMSVHASISAVPSAASPPEVIIVRLTLGGFEVIEELPITDNSASGLIPSLAAGIWNVDVAAVDGEGDVIYEGKDKVEVTRDSVVPLAITLNPVPGRIRFEASADGLPEADSISAAEFWVYHAGGTSAYRSYREVPGFGGRFVVEDAGYVPRSYDLRVIFLREDGSALYESDYIGLGVCPGKMTAVDWVPGFGDLSIEIGFRPCPSAPRDVVVSIEDTSATVSWSPIEGDAIDHHRIYWRYSTQDRYLTSRSSAVEAPASSAVVSLSSRQRGSQVRFVVVARDVYGQESLRSDEVSAEYR